MNIFKMLFKRIFNRNMNLITYTANAKSFYHEELILLLSHFTFVRKISYY